MITSTSLNNWPKRAGFLSEIRSRDWISYIIATYLVIAARIGCRETLDTKFILVLFDVITLVLKLIYL